MTVQSKIRTVKPDLKSPFTLSFGNIRSLRDKFADVESYLHLNKPDIFGLSETALNESVPNSDLIIPGYLPLIRKDSIKHMHGLGIYVRDNLPIAREVELEDKQHPFICLRVALMQSTSYVYLLYRSPASQDCEVINKVSDSIDKALASHPNANIFVCGDFNVHHVDWLTHSNGVNRAGSDTYNFAVANSLTQLVDFPTRFPDREDQSPYTLDLFLTSNPGICKVSAHYPLGTSDHAVVCATISLEGKAAQESPYHRTLFSYERADWDGFRDLLRDVPWNKIFQKNVSAAASEVISWLEAGIDAFVPKRKYQVKPHSSPWFSPACSAAIAHRNHYYHAYQRDNSLENHRLFIRARNCCKSVIRQAKSDYAGRVHERIASQRVGSRDFWRIINSVQHRGKSSIPPLFNGPEVLTSSADKARLFANMFSKNSTLDDSNHPIPEFHPRTNSQLDDIQITVKTVTSIIARLDPSKATGPDGIPVILFQKCSPELSPVLTKLYRKCYLESCFPSAWKLPMVIPVFKNCGDRSDPRNYRPISLLPVISKIFETVINLSLVKHIESLGLFSDAQYGFRSGRSTADLLTVITERVNCALDNSGQARAIALDISKAFDKVWHAGLIRKLEGYGVCGRVLRIISSFLSDRKLKVVLDGQSSSLFSINAGVPQGSVLGPTLFLIFINDLPDDKLSEIAIYADDTTLYSCLGKSGDLFEAVELAGQLQRDLGDITEWGDKWLVSFNSSKTKLLSINRYHHPSLCKIEMGKSELTENDSIRLLGITLTNRLCFNSYIESIAKSAAMKVGSLLRARGYLTPETILYLYKSTIRPCMEYCCHLWSGASSSSLMLLDKVQRRVANAIGENLASKLDSLSHRRKVASLSLFYRYFHGQCSKELADLTPATRVFPRKTRLAVNSHPYFVSVPTTRTESYRSTFFPSTATLWNNLPATCFPKTYDLQCFKANVHQHLSTT